MQELSQETIEILKKLPRSVVDFTEDGGVVIHEVDMVQAQMDREKYIKRLVVENYELKRMLQDKEVPPPTPSVE